MDSQGQPCLKGFPSPQLGAQPSHHQHGKNDDSNIHEHQPRNNKHRLAFDNNLSPQSKRQRKDIDGEFCLDSSIDNSEKCEEESENINNYEDKCVSDLNEAPENGDQGQILPPGEPPEKAASLEENPKDAVLQNVEEISSNSNLLLHQEVSRKETTLQTVEFISEEKSTSNDCGSHGNVSDGQAHRDDKSVNADLQEVSQSNTESCDIHVSTESGNLQGMAGAASSFSSASQDTHCYVVSSPIDQHLPAEFHSQSNTEGNLKIHVEYDYGDMSAHKAVESYNSGGEHQAEPEQSKRLPIKLDLEHLQLLNVGGTVEYMESLPSLVTVKSPSVNDAAKSDIDTSSQDTIIIRSSEQKTSNIDSIPIQVFPQAQGISLVTSSGILTADISTFSTQVPAILTEGDADDTEAAVSFAEQFHVVTTSSALSGSSQMQGQTSSSELLSVMMSSGDLTKGVILTPDQQQALLGEMISPGQTQTLHISIPQVTKTARPIVSSSIPEATEQNHSNNQAEDQASASAENKTIKLQVISNNEDDDNKKGESEGDKAHLCSHANCNKMCQKANKMKLHMLAHTGERPYKCSHEGCEWAFTTAYKLKRHERGHTGERPFVCPQEECNRRFTTAYNLKTHIRTHNRTNTIMCHYEGCGKTFPTLHKFRVHERKHQQEEKPFKCEIDGCGKEFSAMGTLTSHLKSHSGERPHGCPVEGCCKRFTKASKLKLHLRTHTGERPFACDFEGCGWSFTSAYKLKRHMRKHTGERPFVCMYEGCHKSFTRSSHLKTHTLVHTGEKPYVCPIDGCSKAFTAGSSLNVHMRKHTGEKPFKCEEDGCSKAYTTASNLRAHQKRHEKPASFTEGSEDHPAPADFVTVSTMSSVSSAGSLVDNDAEVTYTGINTFSSEDFTPDDVASLPVSVHFPAGSLSAIVTNRGNPLSFSTACSSANENTDGVDEPGQAIQNDMDPKGITTVALPVSSVEQVVQLGNPVDGSQIDVTEFVVRGDSSEPALHGQDASKHSDVENLKHDGGFDLSITSMVSHLRSHETSPSRKLVPSEVLAAQSPCSERLVMDSKFVSSHARSLEFRTPMNPEDQFKPPAVIFQDDCSKSGSSDTEGESSSQPCAVLPTTNPNLMQITLPQEVIQVHFPQTANSPLPPENDNTIDDDVNTSHQSQIYEGASLSGLQDHSINKPDLSPYMDEQSSPEHDDSNIDNYPESTINLQDLR